jgi:CRISPR-associated protein Csh2
MINNNSEILFLYDAQMCNPNGDMDNENKPRIDYGTMTNLVSDLRLKRYLRDYFETVLGKEIYVTNTAENAKSRNKQLLDNSKKHTDLIDVKMFGAVTAAEDKSIENHYIGPVQFNWGYSLHPVEIVDSATIVSSFSDKQGIGKDYRVHYSLIAFSGSINANSAEKTKLSEDDILLLDEALPKAIPLARTRSKIGQQPRLYLRIELKDKKSFLKDLRSLITFVPETVGEQSNPKIIRKIDDYTLDLSKLVKYLEANKDIIKQIHYWHDNELDIGDINHLFLDTTWKQELKI